MTTNKRGVNAFLYDELFIAELPPKGVDKGTDGVIEVVRDKWDLLQGPLGLSGDRQRILNNDIIDREMVREQSNDHTKGKLLTFTFEMQVERMTQTMFPC